MTSQPAITDIHTWDGTHTLPDWLHQDGTGLVLPGRDDDTRPQPGWMLVRWSDGHVTVASPQVAARVYGPDGMRGQLERAEAALADVAAGSYAGRVEELEAALEHTRARLGAALASIRLLRIYANGLDHGHQDDIGPLVASRIRRILAGLDDRPPETAPAGHDHAITQPEPWLHIAFTSPDPTTANTSALTLADFVRAEFPSVRMQITTNAVEAESVIVCTTACDEQHTYDWTCEQFAGIDDSGPADLTGYLAPEPPIGCLTVTAETTPSQRPGLRDDIARAIHRYDREHCLSRNHAPSKDHRGEADAVLTLLYREWPWLRADAEEQQR